MMTLWHRKTDTYITLSKEEAETQYLNSGWEVISEDEPDKYEGPTTVAEYRKELKKLGVVVPRGADKKQLAELYRDAL